MTFTSGSGLENNLDAAVLFVAEYLVHLGTVFEPDDVSDDERRIDLAFLDPAQQIVSPAIDVGLTRAHRQALVHQLTHRDLVDEPAIHAGNREHATGTADVDHLA